MGLKSTSWNGQWCVYAVEGETNKNQNMTSAVNFARKWRLALLPVACSRRGHLDVVSPPHGYKSSRREWKPRRSDVIMTLWSDSLPDPCRCCRRVMWSQIRILRTLQLHFQYVSRIILTSTNGMLFDLHLVFLHMCSPWANIWLCGFDNQAAFFFFLFCFIFFIDHKSNFCFVLFCL